MSGQFYLPDLTGAGIFHCEHPYLYNTAVAVELLSIRIDVTFQDEALYFLAISAMASSRTVGDADTDETLICFRIILSSALVENAITPDNSVANKTDFLNI